MRGRLIVVEGLDGTGKTTFSRALAAALGAAWATTPDEGLRAVRAGVDRWSEQDRPLFYAGAVLDVGRRAVATRGDVVVDRYWATTVAYARVAACQVDLAAVEPAVPPADVTLWLDLDDAERRRRLLARGASVDDLRSLQRADQLRAAYHDVLAGRVAGRVIRLDAAAPTPQLVREALSRLAEGPAQLGLFAAA